MCFLIISNAIFGVPFVVVSSFSQKWVFGNGLCQFYAFITTALGISQITMLTVIALERYFVIVRRDRKLTKTPCRCTILILGCFGHGAFWATGPLLGWSGYKEEDVGIACCVKWETKDAVALSYTIALGILGWLIPLFIIAFGYINIAYLQGTEQKRILTSENKKISKTVMEKRVAITTLTMIGAFIVSWTPYSIVSFLSAVVDHTQIPPWVFVAPAVFAKCSIIWNPLIYVGRHKQFRNDIKKSFRCLKSLCNRHPSSDINGFMLHSRPTGLYRKVVENNSYNTSKVVSSNAAARCNEYV
ncbi:visual pigment-like receptor peropsin [Ruditapes philippinarum]|uniref:visual pigment-like receptor peropsin n=1 Tax=Ruditapes philippinarum TaxID=129788 RepID=UPI00295B90ED|nr:visual pigment-like receptor peropsin [Ruditapes philippinarum]